MVRRDKSMFGVKMVAKWQKAISALAESPGINCRLLFGQREHQQEEAQLSGERIGGARLPSAVSHFTRALR